MNSGESGNYYIYVIDAADRIVSVSDNWLLFAEENGATASCHADAILHKPVWDYISGLEVQHLFEIILGKVRAAGKTVVLPFRCDAPDRRRYLELHITPLEQKRIEFTSHIIREESRDSVELLEAGIPRSDELINMCSICKKVEMPGDNWLEVELAIAALKLFEQLQPPQISHGLCTECFESAMAEASNLDLIPPGKKPSVND